MSDELYNDTKNRLLAIRLRMNIATVPLTGRQLEYTSKYKEVFKECTRLAGFDLIEGKGPEELVGVSSDGKRFPG